MLSTIYTVAFTGIEVKKIEIQTHISSGGLPSFNVVGLANKSIAESRERVRSAFSSIGLGLPSKRIVINLSPADIVKDGTHYDLGIAFGLLVAMGIISQEEVMRYIFMGELSLDGSINSVNGVLPSAIEANAMNLGIVCPVNNYIEANYSRNNGILASNHIMDLINHFKGSQFISNPKIENSTKKESIIYKDLSDVKGQLKAKRGLIIAAAGGHNLLMVGPPGSGKSMLAKRLPGILPPLTPEEILDVTTIASIAGTLDPKSGLVYNRPFREPHSSSSAPAMIGGGKDVEPGEITLAHLGVLFLDELPEFSRPVLESLRQPIESREINIARVYSHIRYPANFQLIAAMNPCKCGYYGSEKRGLMCNRVPQCSIDYQNKISGPILDRFDLQIHMDQTVSIQYNENDGSCISSKEAINSVIFARNRQKERFEKLGINVKTNSELEGENLEKAIIIDDSIREIISKAIDKFSLSMRGVNKILKVSQTICDLRGGDGVTLSKFDVAEAISYRTTK